LRAELGGQVDGWDIDGKSEPAAHVPSSPWTLRRLVRAVLPRRVKTRLNVRRARDRLLPQWKTAIDGTPVSAIVVGGGHLLTGTTEYFPARLSAVAELARELDVDLHVHSVGVSHPDTWEAAAGEELRRFLRSSAIASISVRDEQSAAYLETAGLRNANIRLASDPGLLAERTFGARPRLPTARLRVGLGIMSPGAVSSIRRTPSGISARFWKDVARQLAASGVDVSLFTTGEAGDIREAQRVSDILNESGIVHTATDIAPKDDAGLVQLLAGVDAILAQRLHASIVAYALGVPSVGLGWDPKVRAFYRLTDRLDYFLDDREAPPESAVTRLLEARHTGLDDALRARQIEACHEGIRSLAGLIKQGR
jgi:polysaccharide pyruvyl transferase WcaK-like protein